MATTRSPKYPNISLGDAIAKARAIYSKEHMSAMTPQVAAEAMGYNGINGSSLKTISSLKKYGLLEGRGDDVRLSKDAQTLVIDDANSGDYKSAVFRAATSPEIYSEIRKQFPGVASDRNISVYLEKQGFKPDAALIVARNYRDSMALVSANPAAYGGGEEEEIAEQPMQQSTPEGTGQRKSPVVDLWRSPPVAAPKPGLPVITQDGKMLSISAVVDLKGLRKLKQMLTAYEGLLVMVEQDEEPEPSTVDIKPELEQ